MRDGKFNVITDGQWGSCGKGKIATALAERYRPQIISTTNMPNAGHTAVRTIGGRTEQFVAKALPSAAILNSWLEDYFPKIVLGAAAAFTIPQLVLEIADCKLQNGQLAIHQRAGVVLEEHAKAEAGDPTGPKHVASTMQGCGAFLAEKILRTRGLKLARDFSQLDTHICYSQMSDVLMDAMQVYQHTILHEGAQGFSLDINHGSHYPQCTSRGTTAIQNLADMGLPVRAMGDVYLVIRPYPIRVGNVTEGGTEVGNSGGSYSGQKEIEWSDIARWSGAPVENFKGELTTVTKRLRRVFEFSAEQVRHAARVNGATAIVLNFANYLDYDITGCKEWTLLGQRVLAFIRDIERATGIPVKVVGTGPDHGDICWR